VSSCIVVTMKKLTDGIPNDVRYKVWRRRIDSLFMNLDCVTNGVIHSDVPPKTAMSRRLTMLLVNRSAQCRKATSESLTMKKVKICL
jgi:hypothetical protein